MVKFEIGQYVTVPAEVHEERVGKIISSERCESTMYMLAPKFRVNDIVYRIRFGKMVMIVTEIELVSWQ